MASFRREMALVAVVLAAVWPARLVAQDALELRVKAAFVSKFPQFVEWPEAALANRPSIDVCVLAGDRIETDLRALTAGQTVAGRAVAVRPIGPDDQVDRCHLLFLSSASGAGAAQRTLLQRASSRAVLTIGDDQRFLDEGGIIGLRQVGSRVRFDVNIAAAQKVGLRISSQLLQLALSVREGPA